MNLMLIKKKRIEINIIDKIWNLFELFNNSSKYLMFKNITNENDLTMDLMVLSKKQ